MNKTHLASLVIVALLVGGGAFYGGTVYAKKQSPTTRGTGAAAFQMRGGANGNRTFQNGAMGEIVSKDDNSLTLKLHDGGSKIVFLSASTTVAKMETGSVEDLSAGTNVSVMGSANTDGSVNATAIQIRPAGDIPSFMPQRVPSAQ